MNWAELKTWAEVASILTFIIAAVSAVIGLNGYRLYRCDLRTKSRNLENYLRSEKMNGKDKGQRSILRIVRDVGLTEDEIIQVSFRNPRVARLVTVDDLNRADALIFEYKDR